MTAPTRSPAQGGLAGRSPSRKRGTHMIQANDADLIAQAKQVLEQNRVGRFTKPAPNLYPHQWSWDSAFIAMGYVHYDQARAEEELRALFAAQWINGLVPHIVFNPAAA